MKTATGKPQRKNGQYKRKEECVKRDERIMLGLELSRMHLKPGETRTFGELAIWCGCHRRTFEYDLERALKKMRLALFGEFQVNRERAGKLSFDSATQGVKQKAGFTPTSIVRAAIKVWEKKNGISAHGEFTNKQRRAA
jgi:predicted DNA-binding protein (UPF0251 family)